VQDATRDLGEPLLITEAIPLLDGEHLELRPLGQLALRGRAVPVAARARSVRRNDSRTPSAYNITTVTAITRPLRRWLVDDSRPEAPAPALAPAPPVEIAPDDPMLEHLLGATAAVDIETLDLASPALGELKRPGVKLAELLDKLAAQTAPALRVG
jgi:hypothetical protein